jgi:hypothetical protein
MHRTIRNWLAGLTLLLATFGFQASAQEYTRGVDVSGSTATLWFKPNVTIQWVDVHYTLAGGAQQNFRMSYNSGSARYERAVSPVASGQVLNSSFTSASTRTSTTAVRASVPTRIRAGSAAHGTIARRR